MGDKTPQTRNAQNVPNFETKLTNCLKAYDQQVQSIRSSENDHSKRSIISMGPLTNFNDSDNQTLRRFRPLFRQWLEIRCKIRHVQLQMKRFVRDFERRRKQGFVDQNANRPGMVWQHRNVLNELKDECNQLEANIAQFKPDSSHGSSPSTFESFHSWIRKQVKKTGERIGYMLMVDSNHSSKGSSTSSNLESSHIASDKQTSTSASSASKH